jgi:hypothetical protein
VPTPGRRYEELVHREAAVTPKSRPFAWELSPLQHFSASQLRRPSRRNSHVYRWRARLATTICGLSNPPRSSTVIAGSAWRANSRSADGL